MTRNEETGGIDEMAAQENSIWPFLQESLLRWQAETELPSVGQLRFYSWDWLSSFGSEFWSAIAGAVVGGLIAYILQRSAVREARRERECAAAEGRKALAYSLLFKTIRIFEGLHGLRLHVDEATARVSSSVTLAAAMLGIANLPDKMTFSSDEMAMLLSLGNDDVFNRVVSLDVVHNSILPVWERYALLREGFHRLSKSEHFDPTTGAATVAIKPGSPLEIAFFEANQVANELAERARRDAAEAQDTLIALQSTLSQTLGVNVGLSIANKTAV